MKAAAKRGTKKRRKSAKKTKSGLQKVVKVATSKAYPITETLEWVADGEKLLRKWGAIKSPFAKRIASGFEKILAVLETVDQVRRM